MAKKYQNLFSKGSLIKDKGLIQHEQIKQQITILPELEALIPPLREDEFQQLEDNIQKEGCREALLIWDNAGKYILVDGHNRYRVCQKHKLDFKINLMSFSDLAEVKDWMIDNQLGRRNLTPEQASYLRGMRYELEKQERGGFERVKSKGQNVPLTSERLAEEYNVSSKTIKRDGKYAQGLEKIGKYNPSLKREILAGKAKLSKSDIQQFATLKESEIQSVSSSRDVEGLINRKKKKSYSLPADEKAKQLEYSKERIKLLVTKLGRGNKQVLAELQQEVSKLSNLV